MEMNVLHHPEENRFLVEVDGHIGYVEYVISEGKFDIIHTIVPEAIGGRGIAGALVAAAYAYADGQGLQRAATCSYAARWLERHQ